METPGGAAAVAVWTLQALCHTYDLTLLTYGRAVEPEELNRFYGTGLRAGDFKVNYLKWSSLLSRSKRLRGLRSFQLAVAIREAKQLASQFDALITTINECDLGRRSIQYVHYPLRNPQALRRKYGVRHPVLRLLSNVIFHRIAGTRQDAFGANMTLSNSEWTASLMRKVYGGETEIGVLYPPVIFREIPGDWDQRENGFVCVGRLVPEKRILDIIQILEAVRDHCSDIHLHIVGDGRDRYAAEVRQAAQRRPWVTMEGWIPRDRLEELLAAHRYGIHGAPVEHFGIAIAEMLMAGAIPFVPSTGGQAEIVGNEHSLIYDSPREAVSKITRVLESRSLQRRLVSSLQGRRQLYSAENFMAGMRQAVSNFLTS